MPRTSDLSILKRTAPFDAVLVPIFGFHGFGADTGCDKVHPGGPIPSGSKCCCMVCNKSGRDHWEKVRNDGRVGRPRDEWVKEEERQQGNQAPRPTRYVAPAGGLRGGLGR